VITPDTRIEPATDTSKGLSMDDYQRGIINDDYMRACGVAACLLQKNVFSTLGKVHVKSLNGMKEKLLFRQKPVNDMLRITVYYDGPSPMMADHNLRTKMAEVKRKLSINGLTFLSEDESGNKKKKFIYSFTLMFEGRPHPMWLEVQFSNEVVRGIYIDDHVDYELRRLKRGKMRTDEMKRRFDTYSRHSCGEDVDGHDVDIIMRLLTMKVSFSIFLCQIWSCTIL
jgi:hypothetical protein